MLAAATDGLQNTSKAGLSASDPYWRPTLYCWQAKLDPAVPAPNKRLSVTAGCVATDGYAAGTEVAGPSADAAVAPALAPKAARKSSTARPKRSHRQLRPGGAFFSLTAITLRTCVLRLQDLMQIGESVPTACRSCNTEATCRRRVNRSARIPDSPLPLDARTRVASGWRQCSYRLGPQAPPNDLDAEQPGRFGSAPPG